MPCRRWGVLLVSWGGKCFAILQKAGILIWAVQQDLRQTVDGVYVSVINSLGFCKLSCLPTCYYMHTCKFYLLLHRNKMPSFAGRGYHHSLAQEKSMNNMQRWSMSPMRLPGEFPSWDLCEENREKIKLGDLALDPTSVCTPLTGLQQ